MNAIETARTDRKAIETELEMHGAVFKGKAILCPFHKDTHPSGNIYEKEGIWRFKCHACQFCGDVYDVRARATDKPIAEVLQEARPAARQSPPVKIYPSVEALKAGCPSEVEAIYLYSNPATRRPDMIVIRSMTPEGKTFRQARPQAGGFVMLAPMKPWPIYNRGRIRAAETVVVVEGESCVHRLQEYGVVATTSPAGAGKAEYADWQPLAGKNVTLWGDNDEPGRAHMKQVEGILQNLEPVPRISVIEPRDFDLEEKEDAVDFISQLEVLDPDKAQVQAGIYKALSTAKAKGVAAGVGELLEDTISGKRVAVPWPWSCLGRLTNALLPGKVCLICGNVGASKSFMLLEAAMFWHEAGIKIAIYELEEDRDFHLLRCLAQRSRTGDLTDPEWTKENPEEARKIFAEHKEFLDGFGGHVFASSDTQPTLDDIAAWVKDRAKAGCRVIAVDPITAAAYKGRSTWVEDNAFLHEVKRSAVNNECSIVLITHPVKTVSFADVGQLAGGAAYQRFAQTILWLESHSDKSSRVRTPCGPSEMEHNRTLHILKARNGKGTGSQIAFDFESSSLTLRELGIIIRKKK